MRSYFYNVILPFYMLINLKRRLTEEYMGMFKLQQLGFVTTIRNISSCLYNNEGTNRLS